MYTIEILECGFCGKLPKVYRREREVMCRCVTDGCLWRLLMPHSVGFLHWNNIQEQITLSKKNSVIWYKVEQSSNIPQSVVLVRLSTSEITVAKAQTIGVGTNVYHFFWGNLKAYDSFDLDPVLLKQQRLTNVTHWAHLPEGPND